ncbi:Acg family FMN-binding oxidoreductase [Sulfitobacter sp. MF3-043]|uniref:Acg family FMN-binding oxidoreductase n=1 Tax=Sulfitobacter sediminivivens TaxID=3252902 RepID=UPI0036DEA9A4
MVSRRNLLAGIGTAAAVGGAGYWTLRAPSYEQAVATSSAPIAPGAGSDLEYLVHHAIHAANGHNTQPWMFSRSGTDVVIAPDFFRRTPVVDPDDHHVFASLGCAAENLSLAAKAEGRSAAIEFDAAGDGQVRVALAKGTGGPNAWFDAILNRQCTRSDYNGRAVSAEDLRHLEEAASIEGCRVVLVSDRPKMDELQDLIVAANTVQVEDPDFVAELKSWLRFNARTAIATGDGLYAACSGNPTLPSWIAPTVFGMVFSAKSENEKCVRQVRSSSGLAVFLAEKNDKEHWVKAGQSYQRFALQATAMGMKHAFLNQPTEVPAFRSDLLGAVGASEPRPNLLVRFGYADPMPQSLRRPVSAVIIQS